MMFTGPGCCNGTAESSTPLQHSTFVHRRLLSASTRYYHRLRKRPFLALLCAAASARLSTLVCQLLSIPAKNMLRSSPRSVSIVGGTTFGKPNSPEWSRMYQKDVPILKSTIQRVREAGGIVVACAVGICENEAYEVDHPAQDVRFCPRRPQ